MNNLIRNIERYIRTYNSPPYGREVEGTVELLEKCKNALEQQSQPGNGDYHIGDICEYRFDDGNQSCSIVEIIKILDDPRGIAEIKFLDVITDDTGNDFFCFLLKTGQTMNASLKYLKKISEGDTVMFDQNQGYILISVREREILTEKFPSLKAAQKAMHEEMRIQGKISEEVFQEEEFDDGNCGFCAYQGYVNDGINGDNWDWLIVAL